MAKSNRILNGFMLLKEENGDPIFYRLAGGSPYQLDPDAEQLKELRDMKPGYYDDDGKFIRGIPNEDEELELSE